MVKARWIGIAALAMVVAAAGALAWRHFHPPVRPYLTDTVRLMDIESTVTALGRVAMTRDVIEASVSEADVFKLRAGQPTFFNLVALPDQRLEGTVREIRAIPIGVGQAEPAPAQPAPNDQADGAGALDADGNPVDPQTQTAPATQDPPRRRDPYGSGRDPVFYSVLFDMGSAAGRYPAGMSVTIHVVLGKVLQAPAISALALGKAEGENRYQVEVVDERGRVTSRQITTGLSDNMAIEVKRGLKLGDKVIIRGDDRLYEPGYRG